MSFASAQIQCSKRLWLLMVMLALAALALPVRAAGEEVRGTLDNWGSAPVWSMSTSLGGSFLYVSDAIGACGSEQFKFFRSDSSGQWFSNGGAVTFGIKLTGLSTSTSPNMSYTCTAGKHYAYKWSASTTEGVVFELSAAPVTLTGVSQAPIAPLAAQAALITATTSAAPPAEQVVWLRYTTNAWSTSTVVKMTGSGTIYTATIPGQSNGTTVAYYVFSSGNVPSISGADADLMTLNADTNGGSNYGYTIGGPSIPDAQGLWLDTNTLAWAGTLGNNYRLLYDPDGNLNAGVAGATACSFPAPAAPCFVSLTASGTVSGYWKNPNATGLTRLTTGLSDTNAKHLLKGQVAVASYNSGGTLIDLSRVQIQSVLDALYAASAKTEALGVTYSGTVPTLKVWAPTAKTVAIRRYADAITTTYSTHALTENPASGVWSVTGEASWDRTYFLLDVQVYAPSVDALVNNLVSDPYAVSLGPDPTRESMPRSQFLDLSDADLKPAGWDTLPKPPLNNFEDIVVYEVHIRDFSINDSTVITAADRGTYNAFTYDGNGGRPLSDGMAHLQQLQQAGLTHIHLLPTFDIASVNEQPVSRTVWPAPTGFPRNSDQPQAIVSATRGIDGFNWGYDPMHFGVPDGSYASNPDGAARVREFRAMVHALSENGLRVVMDVVYNHLASSGQDPKSVLDMVVPGYYLRYTTNGATYTSSCCSDTATEYEMMEKLMIDTVVRFAVDYKVDSFRFDLMNLHTRQNMINVKSAIQALTTVTHGVDGNKIYLYGEGWDFGSAMDKGLTTCPNCYAKQYNMTGAGIGLFNDGFRDASHGGYNQDSLQIRRQGFLNGLSYDWNGFEYSNRFQSDLWAATGSVRTGLAGSGSWFADDPQETVNYVEKHDNETLFDQNVFKMPLGTNLADRTRAQNMGTSLIGLAQGIPFFHMGQDILRSKSLDRNSYDSGDWFNRVDWTYTTNYFGMGLPPAWDNSSRWGIMGPLLNNTSLDPASANIQFAAAHMREVLRIRQSSPLFRLTSEAAVNNRVAFYNTDNTHDALVVMVLTDDGLDPNYETMVVLFNANKIQQTYTIGAMAGRGFTLHPVHLDGVDADPVVQTASFNNGTGAFTVPARTTAVFVSNSAPPSSLDFVGLMWPRGGVSNWRTQGGSSTNFEVFVQVYEAGVTPGAGQGANISCFLHWGQYGETWTDLAMTYNTSIGNNDEYKATLTPAMLNALNAGTHGYTAYCKFNTEMGKKWKQDSYNINSVPSDDDQGDGLLTILPTTDLFPAPPAGVAVHLFEWRWADVAKECTYLAQKGYTAVQVSPPNEHLIPTANQGGDPNSDYPWWARYQPVTHLTSTLTSRSGTLAEFQNMVNTCNAQGVSIYVDAVLNHMAFVMVNVPPTGTIGTAGTPYNSVSTTLQYGTQYSLTNFHTACNINDYSDRAQVQNCLLLGLPDLDTSQAYVRGQMRAYLQGLLDMGVKGFRIDAAKHIAAYDLEAILATLTLPGGGRPYIYHEVIDTNPAERVRDWEYVPSGDVQDFNYSVQIIADAFNQCNSGKLSNLTNFTSSASLLDSRSAVVFVDNHDNQRGHGAGGPCVVDHRDGAVYDLANIFMLAYPYGHPVVMSSYYWQSNPATSANDSMGPPSADPPYTTGSGPNTRPVYSDTQSAGDIPANCSATFEDGKWVCEHRRPATSNLVGFRQVTQGEPVTNWWSNTNNHIAFGRGAKGFVALNREASTQVTTYQTSLPQGVYCNLARFDFISATSQCVYPASTTPVPASEHITVTASNQIVNLSLASNSALAIHINARVDVPPSTYTITPTAGPGGSITPSTPQTVTAGGSLTFTIAPNVGYSIENVWVDGVAQGPLTSYTFVNVTANRAISATFSLDTYLLTVNTAGTGSGVVTPTTGTYPHGTVVTLTATPNTGSVFAGWSGDCVGSGACVVTMTAPRTVTATFDITERALTINTTGAGTGVVTPSVGVHTYTFGTVITLQATPNAGSFFGGWGGDLDCGDGVVTLLTDTACTATFTLEPVTTYTLTVGVAGTGSGVVTPTVGTHPYVSGTVVALSATANPGSTFAGWGGDADCADGVVTMNSSKTCTATFTLNAYTLTVATAGTGSGVVTPTVGVYTYTHGTVMTLTASANSGSTFAGWSGDCTGTGACVVTMTAPRTVTATFDLDAVIYRLYLPLIQR